MSLIEYICPATNIILSNNNLEKWQKSIKVSLTIPNKIYRRFGVSNSIEYIKLIKDNIDDLSIIFKNYETNKVEEIRKDLEKEKSYYKSIIANSIKQINDNIIIKLLEKNNDKIKSLYKKLKIVMDENIEDNQISEYLDDFILKNNIYGIFQKNILFGFIVIENNKKFIIDLSNGSKIDTYYIQEIFIDDEYRKKGYGKELMIYIIEKVHYNCRYISLMTTPDNNGMIKLAYSLEFKQQKISSGDPKHSLLFINYR
jgi:ribosomal protein S18 acetylase RimI-like enzyme